MKAMRGHEGVSLAAAFGGRLADVERENESGAI